MAKNLTASTQTIASSGTTSDTLSLAYNRIPLAVVLPATMTGTSMTFLASFDDSTYTPVYYESTQYSVNIGASRHIALNRNAMEGVKYFKMVSTSTETASRSITVIQGE